MTVTATSACARALSSTCRRMCPAAAAAAAAAVPPPPKSVIPPDVVPLTEAHKAAVLATAPILAEHGLNITKTMYKNMLSANPALRDIFSYTAQTTGAQPLALAQSVYGYAANINDLTPLVPTAVRIAEKHAALGVLPEHYGVVGQNLIGAIKEVLGDAFTPELQEAWYHAYWQLAKIFIDAEAGLYASGAWSGWQEFTVASHVTESPTGPIASFTLAPTDPSMLPLKPYKPGQFITVRVWVPELDCFQNRHYSLSDAPDPEGRTYRITVKSEPAAGADVPPGLVSGALHALPAGSKVHAAFPVGSYVLPEVLPANIVFLSAGVGITPNLSILNALAARSTPQAPGPQISWIQGVRNADLHLFKAHVDALAAQSDGRIRTQAYYSLAVGDTPAAKAGRMDVALMDAETLHLGKDTTYYVCGPTSFMHDVISGLRARGVPQERIRAEAFRAGEI